MDTTLLNNFIHWIQTPLGANIVGPLVVAGVIELFLAFRRWLRSIPGRLFRWLEYQARHSDTARPHSKQ
ncbi:hypothetical protein [Paenarthrobacter sp. NCHU4564]|uniref:hypothetical protein n=1 Tax=Paenarthrobacter sp. NCHU4564 TaxID=3451353 RepID=UPI003F9D60C6